MQEGDKKHEPEFIGRVGTIILVQQGKRSWELIFPDGDVLFGLESPYHSKSVRAGFEQQVSDKINKFLKTSFSDMFHLPNEQQENKAPDNNGE